MALSARPSVTSSATENWWSTLFVSIPFLCIRRHDSSISYVGRCTELREPSVRASSMSISRCNNTWYLQTLVFVAGKSSAAAKARRRISTKSIIFCRRTKKKKKENLLPQFISYEFCCMLAQVLRHLLQTIGDPHYSCQSLSWASIDMTPHDIMSVGARNLGNRQVVQHRCSVAGVATLGLSKLWRSLHGTSRPPENEENSKNQK